MSILLYNCCTDQPVQNPADRRYERDALGDIKYGLDLIFGLKAEVDKLHPFAQEMLRRLLSY